MKDKNQTTNFSDVLLYGRGRTPASIAVCLASSGCRVTLCSENQDQDRARIQHHLADLKHHLGTTVPETISITGDQSQVDSHNLAILTGYHNLSRIHDIIHHLEQSGNPDLIIAIATDHIQLKGLQMHSKRPENIVVMNWAEPAHTTFFLEIVHNDMTGRHIVSQLEKAATEYWGKDPYIVPAETGVRGRMITAMMREAMYLIDQGYAGIEDIDRACRNDAGTYMPFAGNFQYMDLMGTFAYGVVMEKLNRELSNATVPPPFFDHISKNHQNGGSAEPGFYEYSAEDMEKWDSRMRDFGFEVRSLITKYPFAYQEETHDKN